MGDNNTPKKIVGDTTVDQKPRGRRRTQQDDEKVRG